MIDVLTQNVQSEPEVDLGVGVHLGTVKGVPIKVYTVSSKFQALSFLSVLFRQLAFARAINILPKFIIAFDQYYINISDKNCSGTQRGSVSTLLVHIETLFFLS